MQLQIQGQQSHLLELTGDETIAQLRDAVAQLESLQASDVLLYAAGAPLSDDQQLVSSLTVGVIDVNVGLKGGKVHGSLARAGKVRGQTPKVEKQEKKKQKTGRAKRRQQYNRRFVNIVQTFGRRRGPNTNS